jgi:hypothetical protein
VGDFAVYDIYERDGKTKIGRHRIEILAKEMAGGETFWRVLIADDQTKTSFLVPTAGLSLNMARCRDIKVETQFGEFTISEAKSPEGERLKPTGRERLPFKDSVIQTLRYDISYEDQSVTGTLWVCESCGPYGVLKAQIERKGTHKIYRLVDVK